MVILPLIEVDGVVVRAYWDALLTADTLKYRFSDEVDPDIEIVRDVIRRMYRGMFAVVESGVMIAEYTLEGFTGKSAQLHFSFHPSRGDKKEVCRLVLAEIFKTLDSVYGLTPKPNRVACIFALRNGFKKLGILPSGCTYMGQIVDAQISVAVKSGI